MVTHVVNIKREKSMRHGARWGTSITSFEFYKAAPRELGLQMEHPNVNLPRLGERQRECCLTLFPFGDAHPPGN